MEYELLTIYCKASDLDALTGVCAAPFYGPAPSLLPQMSAADGVQLSIAIISVWAIGFYIKSGRRLTST